MEQVGEEEGDGRKKRKMRGCFGDRFRCDGSVRSLRDGVMNCFNVVMDMVTSIIITSSFPSMLILDAD